MKIKASWGPLKVWGPRKVSLASPSSFDGPVYSRLVLINQLVIYNCANLEQILFVNSKKTEF